MSHTASLRDRRNGVLGKGDVMEAEIEGVDVLSVSVI